MKQTLLLFFISIVSFGQIDEENISLLTSTENNPKIEEIQVQLYSEISEEYENQGKEIYEFDAAGNQVRWEYHTWNNENNDYVPDSKTISMYDENNRLIQESSYSWSITEEDFIKVEEESVSYDEFGRFIELNTYNYDTEEESEFFTKAVFIYDGYFIENYTAYVKSPGIVDEFTEYERGLTYTQGENNTTTVEIEAREDLTSPWELFSKRIIQFDVNYNLILEEFYEFNNGIYGAVDKEKYVYDLTTNKLLEYYDFTTTSEGDAFTENQKFLYTYDGNMTNEITYYWDSDEEDYILSSKLKVVKNNSNQIIEKENANWNTTNSEYEPINRWVYTYENGYVTSVNTFQGIPFGFHSESTYTPMVEEGVLIERVESFQLLTDEPENRYKYIYNFPELNIENQTAKATEISIFPNPTTTNFTINNAKGSSIEIYNSLGQKVFNQKVISEMQNFQVIHLKNGLYFAKIQKEKNLKSIPILIQK
ncbi:T9SS type A sorting domain-containing protein [Aureivirga marina]|uniref:T9SS type A sorting domain-containing protein n=1 Tax=Aureivirga marina TaxID=1182451 RepID=UPI0018CAA9A0|nr:T9SS type A sorting domain-containing protein [Aureivirga marina]